MELDLKVQTKEEDNTTKIKDNKVTQNSRRNFAY